MTDKERDESKNTKRDAKRHTAHRQQDIHLIQAERPTDSQTARQARQRLRQTDRHTGSKTKTQTNQTNRRQTGTETDRHTK